MIKPGIYNSNSMTNKEYHTDLEYINSSKLKLFPDKVDEFIAKAIADEEKTQAMTLGTAIHAAIFEPFVFEKEYVIEPENIDKRTKAGKETYLNFLNYANGENRQIISSKDAQMIEKMKQSVLSHPIAGEMLAKAEKEQSFFCESGGIKQKVRADAIKKETIIDLKTIDNVYRFEDDVVTYGYHFSAAMYTRIISEMLKKKMEFVFIVVQKKYPYTTKVCQLGNDSKYDGENKYQLAKSYLKMVNETGCWGKISTINLPNWYNNNNKEISNVTYRNDKTETKTF